MSIPDYVLDALREAFDANYEQGIQQGRGYDGEPECVERLRCEEAAREAIRKALAQAVGDARPGCEVGK